MEADRDPVAGGAAAGEAVLGAFWGDFQGALQEAGGLRREEVRAAVERALEVWLFGPAGKPEHRTCPSCGEGRLGLRFGRHGPFVGCGRYPACRYTRPLARDPADDGAGPVALGTDPETRLALTLRTGRYGRYVQRGEIGKGPETARGTVPMGMEADEITPETARALLALPRTVGTHPETGKEILAGNRALRAVAQARGRLRAAARGRGRAHRRPQPRGRAGRYGVTPVLPAPGRGRSRRVGKPVQPFLPASVERPSPVILTTATIILTVSSL